MEKVEIGTVRKCLGCLGGKKTAKGDAVCIIPGFDGRSGIFRNEERKQFCIVIQDEALCYNGNLERATKIFNSIFENKNLITLNLKNKEV